MWKRWFVSLGVIVVLVGGALATALVVSDDDDGASRASSTSLDAIQLAAANTEAAESMQFELRTSGDLGVSASGVVSGDGQQGQVSVELGTFGTFEQRIVDGTVYVQTGKLFGGSAGQWMSLSRESLGKLGDSFGDGSSAVNGSPASALDVLNEAAGPVETVGDDTVGGHHATHYRVSVDAHGTSTPVDVWIDDNDRVVKLQVSAPQGGDLTFEVTAFGVPVSVQAPPADQVTEFPGLSGLLGKGVI